ncbi:MAG: hypothetical protein CVU43_02995 [Chloroflexi bacterium HGW-Chloroflexi-5]|nr:MAG: hypothetical protein CVU43_02995 [Chloroflexi bacterium HGW-Chloroflexi-5]
MNPIENNGNLHFKISGVWGFQFFRNPRGFKIRGGLIVVEPIIFRALSLYESQLIKPPITAL